MADILTEAHYSRCSMADRRTDRIAEPDPLRYILASSHHVYNSQPTPTAINATGTALIADLLTKIITCTSATAVGLLTYRHSYDAGILSGALPVDGSFDWGLINLGSSQASSLSLRATHTFVGLATIALTPRPGSAHVKLRPIPM